MPPKNRRSKDKTKRSGNPTSRPPAASTRRRRPARSPIDWTSTILSFMAAPEYAPMKPGALAKGLKVTAAESKRFRSALNSLLDAEKVTDVTNKGLTVTVVECDKFEGVIEFLRRGDAIVTDADTQQSIFVRSTNTGIALPGDRVRVEGLPSGTDAKEGRLPEGRVQEVVERGTPVVVGTLVRAATGFIVEPMRSGIPSGIVVTDAAGAVPGDRVLVKLAEWKDAGTSPHGEITDVIGPADNPALDTISVARAYDLPDTFPPAAVREAEHAAIDDVELEGRLDLRREFVFTIDPKTARDYDDAISFEPASDGGGQLGVHIADVSHFVTPGSALDKEATRRGTSVYLPDLVIPMLPEQLSNGLCSLVQGQDRLTMSAMMTIDDTGKITAAEFHSSVIHSQRRLTYEQALEALESDDGAALPDMGLDTEGVAIIKQVSQLAQLMRSRRIAAGCLMMDIPEIKFDIAADGRIAGAEPVSHDIAHELIEECMLAANEAVCRELCRQKVPHLHRIHEEPDPEKLAMLEGLFALAGFDAGDLTNPINLAAVVRDISHLPQAGAWNTAVLRAMQKARYGPERAGHYGLAKKYYTHFTSPIRRYPDLIIHRILKTLKDKKKSAYRTDELEPLGRHCSQRETVAAEAEREVTRMKKFRYFAEQLESGDLDVFDAVVIDVKHFGIVIQLPMMQVTGMVHISMLSDDYYNFHPERLTLEGRRSNTVFTIGTMLKVMVCRVDEKEQQIDFIPYNPVPEKKARPKRRGRGRGGR